MKDTNKLSASSEGILIKTMCRRIFRIVCRLQINIVIEKIHKWLEWFIFCLFCGLASLKLYAIIIQRK